MTGDDEEKLLRSVALQNAQSILSARQRAEREVIEAKEVLERKTAELAHSLSMMRATLESTSNGILATDANGDVSGFNQKFLDMWHVPRDVIEQREHRRVLEVAAAQVKEPEAFRSRIEEIYVSSPEQSFDYLELTDGRVFERFSKIQYVEQKNVGRVWSFTDITERTRAEEELRRQREWFEVTLSSIGDAVITTDTAGNITFLNPVAETMTGWTNSEASGQPLETVFNIISEESRQRANNPIDRVLREGVAVALANHTALISRDGTERSIEDSAAPIRDATGRVSGAVMVFHDVTNRRRTENALRDSEERYRVLFSSLPMAVFVCEESGCIQYYNRRAVELWGRAPAYGVEQYWGSLKLFLPDGTLLPHSRSPVVQVLSTGDPQKNVELLIERPDGSRLPVIANFAALKDAGRVVGAVTAFDDITDRKRAEEALKEADRKKDQFLAILAHELRNPLVPIRNGLQILKLDGNNAAVAERARSVMDQALNHMVRLVDDLLDASRITTGKLKLRTERVELKSVVQSALDTAQPVIDEQRQELSVALPERPITIDADPTRLAQVLANLLNNAAKYSEPGGQITLTIEPQDDQVTIHVADNGIGIPADQLPRIFEVFAQVEDTVEMSRGGLGIGLSLVRGLVEMHGGTVEAYSKGAGRGSEFVVRLPIAGAETPSHPALSEASRESSDKRYRILVVDDNHLSCKSTAMFLAMMGHELATARDGFEGIERARAFQPNVILLDIGLPQLNGYETARRIREQPWGKNILLIAVTGYGQEEDRRRSVEAGFDHHIVKPLNIVELEKKLSELDRR